MDFKFAKFDTFQKSAEHLQRRTLAGASVSVLAGILMVYLFLSEVALWRTMKVEDHLIVDSSQGERELWINLDVTFHVLPCKDANLVVEDSKGVPYDEAHVRVSRVPLTMAPVGRRIAKTLAQNPRGPEQHEAAQAQPGCRLTGAMRVKKVAGDFHVAATRQLVNMDGHFGYTIPPDVLASFNASHTIHALSFGPSFPGQVNPLTGYEPASPAKGPNMWQYHIRVVPTLYTYLYGSIVESEQYSASDFVTTGGEGGMNVHPGVWWRFDFSPIMVRKAETRRSILQFLTSMFAILGGVYALSGIIDTVVWRTVDSAKVK